MKTNLARNLSSLTVLGKAFLIVASVTSSSSWAFDPERAWSTTGATGTVDESSQDIQLHLNHASLVRKPEGTFSSGTIRYNVTAVDNLFYGTHPIMALTYKDNGPDSRLFARLWEVNLETGRGRRVLELDSDDFPQTRVRQQQEVRYCDETFDERNFDFETNAYYVEVSMSQKNTGDKVRLEAISVSTENCPQNPTPPL